MTLVNSMRRTPAWRAASITFRCSGMRSAPPATGAEIMTTVSMPARAVVIPATEA